MKELKATTATATKEEIIGPFLLFCLVIDLCEQRRTAKPHRNQQQQQQQQLY